MSDLSASSYGISPAASYPVQVTFDYPEHSSRVLALFTITFMLGRTILLIPAMIVLYAVGIAAFVVFAIAQWVVLFTGHYPRGMHSFVAGYLRWTTRVSAYFYGLTDRYPPFSLSE